MLVFYHMAMSVSVKSAWTVGQFLQDRGVGRVDGSGDQVGDDMSQAGQALHLNSELGMVASKAYSFQLFTAIIGVSCCTKENRHCPEEIHNHLQVADRPFCLGRKHELDLNSQQLYEG